jgi:hypothetical protein
MDSIRVLPSIAEVIRSRANAQGLTEADLHALMVANGGSPSGDTFLALWRGNGGVRRRNVDAIAAALKTNWLNICTEAEEIEQETDKPGSGIFAVIGKLFDFIVGNKRG